MVDRLVSGNSLLFPVSDLFINFHRRQMAVSPDLICIVERRNEVIRVYSEKVALRYLSIENFDVSTSYAQQEPPQVPQVTSSITCGAQSAGRDASEDMVVASDSWRAVAQNTFSGTGWDKLNAPSLHCDRGTSGESHVLSVSSHGVNCNVSHGRTPAHGSNLGLESHADNATHPNLYFKNE